MKLIATMTSIVVYTTLILGLLLSNLANLAAAEVIGQCFRSLKGCDGESHFVNVTLSKTTPANLGGACGSFGNISGRKVKIGTVKNCADLFVPVVPSVCATGNGENEGRPYQFVCLA